MVHRSLPNQWLDATWIKNEKDRYTMIEWADENKAIHYDDAPFSPYFFIERGLKEITVKKEVETFRGNIVSGDFLSPSRKKLIKLEMPYPSSVRTVRDRLEARGMITYESMTPFIRRVVWDKEINQCPLKDRVAFDIEVDAREGFPDSYNPFQRILSVALVGSDGKEYFFSGRDEKEIFHEFHRLLKKKYHLLTGWNIRDFDLRYWRARAKAIGFKIPFTPIQEIDAMLNYQKASAWGFMGLSYKLDDVADRELGLSKVSFRTKARMQELWDSFVGNRKLLEEYNMNDAKLVLQLDQKLRLSELYVTLSRFVKLLLRDAVWVSACAEALIMRELQQLSPRICFPRRQPEASGSLPGGFVMEPKSALEFFLYHWDFTSLYNRLIQTFSLSPEIWPWFEQEYSSQHGFSPHGLCLKDYVEFVHGKISEGKLWAPILPKILRKLETERKSFIAERDKIQDKDGMEYVYYQIGQTALKLIILGCWGIIGRKNTMFYNLGLARNITLGGQDVMTSTIKLVENLKKIRPLWTFKVNYADTDGLFFTAMNPEMKNLFKMVVEIPELYDVINLELKKLIKERYGVTDDDYNLNLSARYVMTRCFFITKKRYIGRAVWEEGKLGNFDKVAGIEMRRSDAFDLLKDSQREAMKIVLESPESEIESELITYSSRLRKELFSGSVDKKLIITTGTKKKIEDYEANSPQRRVIEQLSPLGIYRPGDDVSWVIVGKTRKGTLKVRALIPDAPKLPEISHEGYEIYWQRMMKFFEKVLKRKDIAGCEKLDKYIERSD